MEMVLLVDNDPPPPPPSHHILILLPKLPNPPPPLSSHFRISYILQISAFFLFSNFRKGRLHYILLVGWLVSWLASPLIFLLQMIPLFPSPVFFSSVDQIFSFTKYFPPFPSPLFLSSPQKDIFLLHCSSPPQKSFFLQIMSMDQNINQRFALFTWSNIIFLSQL